MLQKLGIPVDWFGPLTAELSVAGKCVIPGLTQLFVVRGGGHDTACAVHSLPQIGGGQESAKETVWLSCGSWSILGALTEQPIMSGPALECGVTNEVCTDGRIRPLLNLTGLWILQECQRHWAFTGQESDIAALVSAASQAPSLGVAIDTNDPEFVAPFDMVNRVQAYLQRNFGLQADSPGQLVRVILESLALRYAKGVGDLEDVTGQRFKVFHLLGGGSRNELLCDLAAGATGLPVSAGPAEASAFGALISQFETLGVTQPSQRQQIIAGSTTTRWHLPDNPVGQAVDWAKLRSQSLKTIN